jgi:hypothetical protein
LTRASTPIAATSEERNLPKEATATTTTAKRRNMGVTTCHFQQRSLPWKWLANLSKTFTSFYTTRTAQIQNACHPPFQNLWWVLDTVTI